MSDYRELAKRLAAKIADNVLKTLSTGHSPDLYFKPEEAIYKALMIAEAKGIEKGKREYLYLLQDFESEDGNSQN